ncbi:PilT/PilU family type 4a pilus ATPase [Frigoribacterium sp. PhB116]|uniref:PilT/PilU family type 4a pilus ATPase n=1 Tax=Frigoribacterium sp. PhB116 TaxID=2485174 RepID=UPI0010D15DF5|nr:PilT/PilU family type 4a pilus ATPase [Frigoribacterium sp. PhB116]TDT63957.1 twitching motility protein PilT [Frigoribacterium sp. PhB116]
MSDNVFEIPDQVDPADGWTPGTPGNDLGTQTPATSWELPKVVTPLAPHVDEAERGPVYSMDDAGGEAVLGWSPTPAPTSRRAARLASALEGGGMAARTPWSDPRFDDFDDAAAQVAPASPAVGGVGSGAPQAFMPAYLSAETALDDAAAASSAASLPDVSSAAPTSPVVPAASSAPSHSAAPAPVSPQLGDGGLLRVPAFAPSSAQHAALEAPPVDQVESRPGIELHEHARTVAHPALISALCEVVLQGASDLHVTVDAAPTLRVDGGLQSAFAGGEPWDAPTVSTALTSLLTPAMKEQFDERLELDFAYSLSDESRFRVNFYQQRGVMGAAFRLIPTEIKQLADLGVPEVVSRFAKLPRGLVLVTGPTGSGKSTTLAALIDLVNRTRADHIVTVEDPIEFMHQHKKAIVNQREVGHDTHSFANALKHVLRQDPDVILIGELRDLETISVALTAAETGHLVFATLHTQSAAQTIDRVIDVFPPHQQDQVRTQLASTLQGVVCQTLLPKAGGKGRVVATEIMMMTPAIGNLVREGKTYQISSSMQAGRDLGMHTMDQKLADLVNTGTVTHKAAMEKVHDTEGFDRLVTRVINKSETVGLDAGIDFGDAFSIGSN